MYPATPTLVQIDNKWWFYDETWTDCYGPFDTELEASHGCNLYAEYLDFGYQMPRIEELKELWKTIYSYYDSDRGLKI